MDLSVIIPIYNATTLINRCLDSIFSQQEKYEVEVICVDDGSTDNSVEIIENRKEQNITLLHQENAGPAKARNKGMSIAKGKYMAYLDADDYWLPGFIEETISFLESNPGCIAVSVGQEHHTTSGVNISPKLLRESVDEKAVVLDDFYSFWAKHNHVCTGSIVIKTDIAKSTGGQREDLRICEDLEFWAYLATFGKIGFIPKVLFVSDGTKLAKETGWIEKHIKRWNAATAVDIWEKRLKERFSTEIPGSYKTARGRIAQNLSYSIILSKRYGLAKEQVLKYGNEFPNGKMKSLLTVAVKFAPLWYIVSRMLTYREFHRFSK